MLTLSSVLDEVREILLSCTGSPHSRSRQLAALRKLDAHLLADIGLTEDEARRGFALRNAATDGAQRVPLRLEIRRLTPNR